MPKTWTLKVIQISELTEDRNPNFHNS